MRTVCETMALYVVPAVRAMIARDLIEGHRMTQKEAAKRLGMTQPAVSQYKKHLRGTRTKTLEKDGTIEKMVTRISGLLAKNEIGPEEAATEICGICRYVRENKLVGKIV